MATPQKISRAALRRIGEPPALPSAADLGDPAPSALACDGLDDATTRYILATRPAFEELRHATGQIASLLILQATGASSATPDHPMLQQALEGCAAARDVIAHAKPTAAAAHHHLHLRRALALVVRAAEQAVRHLDKRGDHDVDAILKPLRQGWQEIHFASAALPGFEPVSFGLACCAAHYAQPRAPQRALNER